MSIGRTTRDPIKITISHPTSDPVVAVAGIPPLLGNISIHNNKNNNNILAMETIDRIITMATKIIHVPLMTEEEAEVEEEEEQEQVAIHRVAAMTAIETDTTIEVEAEEEEGIFLATIATHSLDIARITKVIRNGD